MRADPGDIRKNQREITGFKYPSISYTIGESDLRLPELPPLTRRR